MSDDSPELEALFDSIASAAEAKPANAEPAARNDTPELESLFDSIAQAVSREGGEVQEGTCPERVFSQLGQMTRGLHNLLRELGYDKRRRCRTTAIASTTSPP
jgi:chemotaxis protein CheZ